MNSRSLQYMKPLAGIAALCLLAACSSDLTGGDRHPVQLSVTSRGTTSASTIGVGSDLIVGPNGELVLKKVQLVLRKIDLDRIGTADCVGDINDENDDDNGDMGRECEEVFRGPRLIDLPVDGTLVPVIQGLLASGEFTQLEAKLAPARGNSVFETDHPDLAGKSVRVEGTFKDPVTSLDVPFVFTSPVRAKLEMEFDPPLVVDADTKNATVKIDVGSWFLTSSGAVIDPRTATSGSTNLAVIENNIRRSFHAFEDDHERGEDRHEGHNGNDDGEHH